MTLKESFSMSSTPPALPDVLPCKSVDFDTDAWIHPGTVAAATLPPSSPVSSPMKQREADEMSAASTGPSSLNVSADDIKLNEAPQTIRNSVAGIQEQARPEAVTVAGSNDAAMFCRGLYDFSTEHPADLKFRVNDVIRVLTPAVDPSSLDPSNPQWLMGEVLSQEKQVMATGSFPSNYIEFFPAADLDSYLLNVQPF